MNLKAGASPLGDAVSWMSVCRSEEMMVSFHRAVWVWLYVVVEERADVQACGGGGVSNSIDLWMGRVTYVLCDGL